MTIRQATIGDLEGILKYAAQIAAQHQAYNPLRFSVFPAHRQLLSAYFKEVLVDKKAIVNVLIVENDIMGYALVKMDGDSLENMALARAWLHDIYIDDKARGLGSGHLLLEASKNAAIALGSTVLMLHVAIPNTFAKQFLVLKRS
jgi:GNAT superfamily N-acetyltransferase